MTVRPLFCVNAKPTEIKCGVIMTIPRDMKVLCTSARMGNASFTKNTIPLKITEANKSLSEVERRVIKTLLWTHFSGGSMV